MAKTHEALKRHLYATWKACGLSFNLDFDWPEWHIACCRAALVAEFYRDESLGRQSCPKPTT